MLRALVLGAAAGGGFPQWNCNCPNCRRARSGDLAARPATQASVAVSADDRHWFLLNASPDLRQQIAATPALQSRGSLRSSPIAGVVVINGDVDAVAGLLNLREGSPFSLYGHQRVLDVLAANRIFSVLDPAHVRRLPLPLDRPTALELADGTASGLVVEAFAVPGKVALWLEDAAAGAGYAGQAGDTLGLHVRPEAGGAGLFFIPACARATPELKGRLDGAAAVFFDGTLWQDDEMIRAGLGTKTGQRMGHLSMSGPEGSMAALAAVEIGRRIFIHINNSNPALLSDSAERAALRQAGWEVAFDGMELTL